MPWEILAAMDEVVFNDRQAAYSDTSSQRFNVPWLSLVIDGDARLVRRALIDFQNGNVWPEAVFNVLGTQYSSQTEAQARYQAAINWFEEYGILRYEHICSSQYLP